MFGKIDPRNELEVLRQELREITELIKPIPYHKIVAEDFGYSYNYINQIKNGKNMFDDTSENRETLRNIISLYRALIKEQSQKMSKL